MSRKLIIALVVLAIMSVGGFFVFQQIQTVQKQQSYEASSDKVADDFLRALQHSDVKGAMKLLSSDLNDNYGENYWKTTVFAEVHGFKDWPTLKAKGAVQPASPDVPSRYDSRFNQQATQYDYDFKANNATYRLSLVIFRQDNAWKINEVNGGYLP